MTAPHIDLDRLEEVAKAATLEEWHHYAKDGKGFVYVYRSSEKSLGRIQSVQTVPVSLACTTRPEDAQYIAAANPAVVLELVARLRCAEVLRASVAAWWKEHEYDVVGERGEWNLFDSEPEFVTLARELDYPNAPNDPLDDVLPLPAERAPESMTQQLKDDLDDLFIATSPLWETPEEAQAALDKAREQRRQSRQPKILPDNFPKSLDLDDTEGGSHD